MHFSSLAIGIAGVLGYLASASPVDELAERSTASANSYLIKEGVFSYETILKNLGNTGINAPGTAAGLLIASPNTENPDCRWTNQEARTS
jgi:glucoamylase